eukprot:1631203-Ditylum_brightwellii.AAC.1
MKDIGQMKHTYRLHHRVERYNAEYCTNTTLVILNGAVVKTGKSCQWIKSEIPLESSRIELSSCVPAPLPSPTSRPPHPGPTY